MLKYVVRRILYMIPVLLGIILIMFVLMELTGGDPALAILGEGATPEAIDQVHEQLGLDDPFMIRLGRYYKQLILEQDFGTSYMSKKPVLEEIMARYPTTLKLALLSVLFGMVVGAAVGIISAVRQYSILDKICVSVSLFGVSAPSFWIAMMLVLLFSVKFGLLPASGNYGWQYWILPVCTMGGQVGAIIMRMARSSMLEVIRQDYIRTAKAKGQTALVTIMKHAFRNALIPIVTQVGLQLCALMAGSVMIETVFALPGLGKYIVDSVNMKDTPAAMGTILFIALNCIVINLIVDICYGFIDPRIRAQYGGKPRRKKVAAIA